MKPIDDMSETYINNYHKIIGLNVKRIRNEKGISQLDLAHKIGHKSVSIISCAEINHKNMSGRKQFGHLTHSHLAS